MLSNRCRSLNTPKHSPLSSCRPCLGHLQLGNPPCCSFLLVLPVPSCADAGLVDEGGRPTELGQRQGVGFSSHMNVCINKLLAYSTE